MGRVIKFSGWYSESLLRDHPDKTFVFGDNLLGFGKGGQAIIRSEPNAYGVPTKRKPSMGESAFFADDSDADMDAVLKTIGGLWAKLEAGETIVIPVTKSGAVSLGLERAMLKERAPSIYNTIEMHVREMGDAFGYQEVADENAF